MVDLFVFTPVTETEHQLPVFMYGAGYLSNQYPISRTNGFPYFQWIQCVSGEGRLITDGQTQTVKANQVMLLFPNSPHEYYATREPWEIHWFDFGGYAVESIIRIAGITTSGAYTLSHSDVLLTHLKNAYIVAQSGRGLVGLECAKLAYMMLMDMIRYIRFNDDSLEQRYAKLQPVFEYIEKKLCGCNYIG